MFVRTLQWPRPVLWRSLPQPELLGRTVALHRRLVQSGQNVLAQGVEQSLQCCREVIVVDQRLPELIDRQSQLLTGGGGGGSLVQPFQHLLLFTLGEERCRLRDRWLSIGKRLR